MDNLHERHMELIGAVNDAKNELDHHTRQIYLRGWRDGVGAIGMKLDMCAADMYYLDQGIDRPMCFGVWLDWMPKEDGYGLEPLNLKGSTMPTDNPVEPVVSCVVGSKQEVCFCGCSSFGVSMAGHQFQFVCDRCGCRRTIITPGVRVKTYESSVPFRS